MKFLSNKDKDECKADASKYRDIKQTLFCLVYKVQGQPFVNSDLMDIVW